MLNTIQHVNTQDTLYQAGAFASNFDKAGRVYARLDEAEKGYRNDVRWHLESYHYIQKESYVKKIRKEGVKVFLDSGAFSAYATEIRNPGKGVKIDLAKYCDYCQKNKDIILFPSVLDVINFNDKNASTDGTWYNQMEMERRFKESGTYFDATGFAPLPAIHYGEPDSVVKYYTDNYSYVAFGGLVPISTEQMIYWLDHVFEQYICDKKTGIPKVKVHGFGVTSLPIMRRYPWYSVDSSTWVMWAANGLILHPERGIQINISSRSASKKVKGQHIDNIVEVHRDLLEAELVALGAEVDRLRVNYFSRWAWNISAFQRYIQIHKFAPKFKREDMVLFP